MDGYKNFAKSTLASGGITSGAASLTVATGQGARFPAVPFNATIWNKSDYPYASDDPNVEIVRVTAVSGDTFTTIVRGQESTAAAAHNTAGKTYGIVATFTAKTLVQDLLLQGLGYINVLKYGADPTGVADSTSAIQAAIDVGGPNVVFFPQGIYKITSTLTVSQDGTCLVGIGNGRGSTLLHAPTANGSLLVFSAGGSSDISTCGVQGIIFSSADTTYVKKAVEVIRAASFIFARNMVYGFVDASNASMGIQFKGHEAVHCFDNKITANNPIRISDNPSSTIDADHYHFNDNYLTSIGSGNHGLHIDDGLNITTFIHDGDNPYVGGGFYWSDTTNSGANGMVRIQGIRFEQTNSSSEYIVYFKRTANVQRNVIIEDCEGGTSNAHKGYHIEGCSELTIRNSNFTGSAGAVGVEITNCDRVIFDSFFVNTGSTVTMTSMTCTSTEGALYGVTHAKELWEKTTAAGFVDVPCGDARIKGQKWQCFRLQLTNTGGSQIQHKIFANSDGLLGNFSDRITGASATFANTPQVDASTAFIAGVGINAAATHQLIFDTAAQINADTMAMCVVELSQTASTGIRVRIRNTSSNVNGVTRNRFGLAFVDAAGSNWALTTANIGSGVLVQIGIMALIA